MGAEFFSRRARGTKDGSGGLAARSCRAVKLHRPESLARLDTRPVRHGDRRDGSRKPRIERGPLAEALGERARLLGAAFRSVAFAQVRIAALNAGLTAVYLMAVVPAMGIHVPFAKTMIAVTLITGLLPVVGNLIANVVITLVSLSVSPVLAVTSLVFLIVIRKLEYFVNARVMSGRIQARAWELLVAMLIMDAIFGVSGIVAAPIYYAYAKKELSTHNLI